MEIIGIFQFRVTRNSDLYVDDEEVTDLRQALKGELSQRNYGDAVRIETHKEISSFCLNYLLTEFKLEKKELAIIFGTNVRFLGRKVTRTNTLLEMEKHSIKKPKKPYTIQTIQ